MYLNPNEPFRRLSARPAPTLALFLGMLVLGAGLYVGRMLMAPSPVVPATADARLFSAERAMPILVRLVGEERQHMVDTDAGDAARQRVVAEFAALGYEVELQTAWGCREQYATCANTTNVLARLPGSGSGPALMLTAHYDSVGAGPSVSDDMVAVASIIEVARMLRGEPQLMNDVLFVITDGEEVGLTGAEAFLEHPWVSQVGLIANYEARGTGGQSLMFQTSPGNAWLVERLAAAAPRPATSSLLYEIYRLLPNDTDLSVYLDAGLPGINFAYVEHVQRYHTPNDDLQHLSLATFQHQGENVLAAVRAYGNADLANMPAGNAIYQDVYPGVVVQAPADWALWLAGGALVLWLLIVLALIGSGAITAGGLLLALLTTLLGLAAAAGLGYGAAELIRLLTGSSEPWFAYPAPARLAVWAAGALGFLFFATLAAKRAGFWGMAAAVWLWWSGISLAAALMLPGTSIAPLLPTLVATVVYAVLALFGVGLPARRSGTIGWLPVLLSMVTMFAAGYFMVTLAFTVELGLGFGMSLAIGLLVALATTSVAPLLAVPRGGGAARNTVLLLVLLTLAAGVVWAIRVPTYSAEKPQHLNLYYVLQYQNEAVSSSRWAAGAGDLGSMPPAVVQAGGFDGGGVFVRGYAGPGMSAPAPTLALQPPTVTVVADTRVGPRRQLTLRLDSPRNASQIRLSVSRAMGLSSVDLPAAGRSLQYPVVETAAYDTFTCHGRSCNGLEVTLHLAAGQAFDLTVIDVSLGLPEEGAALLAARPITAVPAHEGDGTVVTSLVRMEAAE